MAEYVVFHSVDGNLHCDDGFAAAMVAKMARPAAVLVPGVYGQPLKMSPQPGDQIYFVDFSLKRDKMVELAKKIPDGTLTVLDHHKTAEAELDKIHFDLADTGLSSSNIVFDMDHSGCVMAWNYFFPGLVGPRILEYIQDGDLWLWQLPKSKEVQAALRSYPQTSEVWFDKIDVERLAEEGVAIRRWFDRTVQNLMRTARAGRIRGHECLVCSAPTVFASELAGELAVISGSDFGAVYNDIGNRRNWSLRSRDHLDVSAIAVSFGGGGHHHAAGFSTYIDPPTESLS